MAYQTPFSVQNENFPIHRGKAGTGLKADVTKPVKTARKALKDVSNTTSKPPVSALKEKSVLRQTNKETNKTDSKSNNFLTEEQINKCREWAKEGIEYANFTGNDIQKLQRDQVEKRVEKKVKKAVSAVHEWSNMIFDLVLPVEESVENFDGVKELELEPEIPPENPVKPTRSDLKKLHDEIDAELEEFLWDDHPIEFKLKEDY